MLMATSSRRTQVNQQNALKSTGPRTKEGKATGSVNAVQHGILSRHLILPGESRDEFDPLLQQLMTEQQPVGILEQALVERMAVALRRQSRPSSYRTSGSDGQPNRTHGIQGMSWLKMRFFAKRTQSAPISSPMPGVQRPCIVKACI